MLTEREPHPLAGIHRKQVDRKKIRRRRLSTVDSEQDKHGMAYTDWLTDTDGRPIARPLHTYGPPQPQRVGDHIGLAMAARARRPGTGGG